MFKSRTSFIRLFSLTVLLICAASYAQARDYIRIGGSATVYPFMSLVAESYSMDQGTGAPMVEANGTGGGFAQFCKGVGFDFPDINDASRKITPSELALCHSNGVDGILEIEIGYDGIALIYPKSVGKDINLSTRDLFLALSKMVPSKNDPAIWVPNFYHNWHDINPALPNIPINVMGPPSTSGTRDVLVENLTATCLALLHGNHYAKANCGQIRYDGVWKDGSENYNLVLQKVTTDPTLFAVMGFNYFNVNSSKVNSVKINNVKIDKESIASHTYALSRPLFVYVKQAHLEAIPSLKSFVEFLISPQILSSKGLLAQHGLVPLPPSVYQKVFAEVNAKLNN